MPKSIRKIKKDGYWTKVVVPTKFRIGTRKGGKSANLMSDAALIAVIATNSKDSNKARTVLANRSIF